MKNNSTDPEKHAAGPAATGTSPGQDKAGTPAARHPVVILISNPVELDGLTDTLTQAGLDCHPATTLMQAVNILSNNPRIRTVVVDLALQDTTPHHDTALDIVRTLKGAVPRTNLDLIVIGDKPGAVAGHVGTGEAKFILKPLRSGALIDMIGKGATPDKDVLEGGVEVLKLHRQFECQAATIASLLQHVAEDKARERKLRSLLDRLMTAAGVMRYRIDGRDEQDLVALAQYIVGQTAAVRQELGFPSPRRKGGGTR